MLPNHQTQPEPLKAGAFAPNFRLQDRFGRFVELTGILKLGPAVVCFHCDALDALPITDPDAGTLRRAVDVLGGMIISIFPAVKPCSASNPDGLGATTHLADIGSRTACAYGVSPHPRTAIPSPVAAVADPLAIRACFVVGIDRRIMLAFLDPDCRSRIEPAMILSALAGLRPPFRAAVSSLTTSQKDHFDV